MYTKISLEEMLLRCSLGKAKSMIKEQQSPMIEWEFYVEEDKFHYDILY